MSDPQLDELKQDPQSSQQSDDSQQHDPQHVEQHDNTHEYLLSQDAANSISQAIRQSINLALPTPPHHVPPPADRDFLKGISAPTREQWLMLFEDAQRTSAKEVTRNNPIKYATFCTRQTKYKNGDIEAACMPLGKPGRPPGGGGKKRKRGDDAGSEATDESEEESDSPDQTESFGTAPNKRIPRSRLTEDGSVKHELPLPSMMHPLSINQSMMSTPGSRGTKRQSVNQSMTPSLKLDSNPQQRFFMSLDSWEQSETDLIEDKFRHLRDSFSDPNSEHLTALYQDELRSFKELAQAAREGVNALMETRQARKGNR